MDIRQGVPAGSGARETEAEEMAAAKREAGAERTAAWEGKEAEADQAGVVAVGASEDWDLAAAAAAAEEGWAAAARSRLAAQAVRAAGSGAAGSNSAAVAGLG